MASDLHVVASERVRVYLTGAGAGLEDLHAALAPRPDLELLGGSGRPPAHGDLNGNVDVVLHTSTGERPLAVELAAVRKQTKAPIILLAAANIEVVLEQALSADLADVLVLPQPTEAVAFAIRRVSQERGGDDRQPDRGRVITVFSPKGGAGKSVVATNLAASYARHGMRAVLIDLDLQFGDAALMLGLVPEKTIYDLVSAPGELDADKLAGYACEHPSGFSLIAAPARPEHGERVTEKVVRRVIEVARDAYEVVVVDTAPAFDTPMLAALDASDDLVLLAGPDVPSVKNVRLGLQTLEALSFPLERITLVYNRHGAKGGTKAKDLEQALGREVRFALPDDDAVPSCVNRGTAVVLVAEKARFSRALDSMAGALVRRTADAPGRRGLRRGKRS